MNAPPPEQCLRTEPRLAGKDQRRLLPGPAGCGGGERCGLHRQPSPAWGWVGSAADGAGGAGEQEQMDGAPDGSGSPGPVQASFCLVSYVLDIFALQQLLLLLLLLFFLFSLLKGSSQT